jgi:hypothetical protein
MHRGFDYHVVARYVSFLYTESSREVMGQRSLRVAWYSGLCPLWSNASGALGGTGEGCSPGEVHNTEALSRDVLSRSRSRLIEVSSSSQRWRCGSST